MKTLRNHVTVSHAYGRSYVNVMALTQMKVSFSSCSSFLDENIEKSCDRKPRLWAELHQCDGSDSDESVILGVLHFSMKTLRNHVTVSHAYGRSYVNVMALTQMKVSFSSCSSFLDENIEKSCDRKPRLWAELHQCDGSDSDESVILGVLHFSMKTLRSHVTVSHAYGRSYVNVMALSLYL